MRGILKTQIACFIGHRDIPEHEEQKIITRIRYRLEPMINRGGLKYFGIGGGTGFDMFIGEYLLELRIADRKRIKIISVLPYPGWQERENWTEKQKKRQSWILMQSDKVTYASDSYTPDAYQLRNQKLIDESAFCFCFCNRPKGNTAEGVRYAMQKGLEVFNASNWDINQLRAQTPARIFRF